MEKFYCDIWEQKINENQCYLKKEPLGFSKNRYCLDCSKYKDLIPPESEKALTEKRISKEKKPRSKETYRKKTSSGTIKRDLNKEYLDFIKKFRKIPKKPPRLIIDFLIDKFGMPGVEEKNEDLKIVVFFCKNEELRKVLVDLGNRGANITNIWNALKTPNIDEYLINGHPVGLQLYEGELTPYWNDKVKNFDAKRKEFLKKEKAIRGAIRLITALKPITLKDFYKDELPWVNERLLTAQKALNEMIDIYLNTKAIIDGLIGYPAKWGMPIDKLVREKFRPFTQKSHKVWSRRIVILVDELKGIVDSDRQAYTRVSQLLHLAFPHVYKDQDANLVRQRYTYQKKHTCQIKPK